MAGPSGPQGPDSGNTQGPGHTGTAGPQGSTSGGSNPPGLTGPQTAVATTAVNALEHLRLTLGVELPKQLHSASVATASIRTTVGNG